MTIRRLAVIGAVAPPGNRHFQVENTAFDYDVRGALPKPAKSRFRKCLRVTGHRFRYRVDGYVYYLPRYRHIFRRNCRTNKDTGEIGRRSELLPVSIGYHIINTLEANLSTVARAGFSFR